MQAALQSRFKPSTPTDELDKLSVKQFAQNTDRKIAWAIKTFWDWRKERMVDPSCPSEILWCSIDNPSLCKEYLCKTLCQFVNEVRRKDGLEFPGKTLYNLVLCVQFYLEKKGIFWKLVDDPDFVRLKFTIDNLMKKGLVRGCLPRWSHNQFHSTKKKFCGILICWESKIPTNFTVLFSV